MVKLAGGDVDKARANKKRQGVIDKKVDARNIDYLKRKAKNEGKSKEEIDSIVKNYNENASTERRKIGIERLGGDRSKFLDERRRLVGGYDKLQEMKEAEAAAKL